MPGPLAGIAGKLGLRGAGNVLAGTRVRAAITSGLGGLGLGSFSDGNGGPVDSMGDSMQMGIYAVVGLIALIIIQDD